MVSVIVRSDQGSGAVVKPQVGVDSDSGTRLIRVAVNGDKRFLVECELDVGLFGDCRAFRPSGRRKERREGKC